MSSSGIDVAQRLAANPALVRVPVAALDLFIHRDFAWHDECRHLIGLIETFWSGYFTIEYKDVASFSILVLVLISFVLTADRLVTVRYFTPKPIRAVELHARRDKALVQDNLTALHSLLDSQMPATAGVPTTTATTANISATAISIV